MPWKRLTLRHKLIDTHVAHRWQTCCQLKQSRCDSQLKQSRCDVYGTNTTQTSPFSLFYEHPVFQFTSLKLQLAYRALYQLANRLISATSTCRYATCVTTRVARPRAWNTSYQPSIIVMSFMTQVHMTPVQSQCPVSTGVCFLNISHRIDSVTSSRWEREPLTGLSRLVSGNEYLQTCCSRTCWLTSEQTRFQNTPWFICG